MNQHEKRHPQWEHTTQPQEAEKKMGGGGGISLFLMLQEFGVWKLLTITQSLWKTCWLPTFYNQTLKQINSGKNPVYLFDTTDPKIPGSNSLISKEKIN